MKKIFWIFGFCGACANFTAFGIGRFSYPPLIPFLVNQRWMTQPEANIVANGMFFGFIAGVLHSNFLLKKFNSANIIRTSMAISVVSFLCASINVSPIWIGLWMLLVGVQTGILYAISPEAILSMIPSEKKGKVSGIMFMGIGAGFVLSGLIVPYVAKISISLVWGLLALLLLVALVLSWKWWPVEVKQQNEKLTPSKKSYIRNNKSFVVMAGSYFTFTIGYLGVTLFMGEYLAEVFQLNQELIAVSWMLVGVGGFVGSFCTGSICHKISLKVALVFSTMLLSLSTLTLAFSTDPLIIYTLSFVAGVGIFSAFAMFSAFNSHLYEKGGAHITWKYVVLAGAVGQWLGSLFFGRMLSFTGFNGLFILCSIVLLFSAFIICFVKKTQSDQCTVKQGRGEIPGDDCQLGEITY